MGALSSRFKDRQLNSQNEYVLINCIMYMHVYNKVYNNVYKYSLSIFFYHTLRY